jgi:hypothetical protein
MALAVVATIAFGIYPRQVFEAAEASVAVLDVGSAVAPPR